MKKKKNLSSIFLGNVRIPNISGYNELLLVQGRLDTNVT